MLLIWSSFWYEEVLVVSGFEINSPWVHSTIYFFQFISSQVLYISVIFFTNPNYRFKTKDLLFLVVPAIYATLLFFQNELSSDFKPIRLILLFLHSLFYNFISYLRIRRHRKKTENFSSNPQEINLQWLEYIILALLIIAVSTAILNLAFYEHPINPYLALATLITIFFIGYGLSKQKEIFPIDQKQRKDVLALNEQGIYGIKKRKLFSEEKLVELKSKINTHMIEREPHLDNDINLAGLSDQLELSPHQLSYVINNGFNENFYHFINRHRVDKAKSLLSGTISDKYSILGIAFESGFNSKTSFNTAFKNVTGQTPSEFKKKQS
ncbi:AraC family transcriptional regulator [Flagellimonas algicola]|nr:helix-turn-helix domain-containing protein [Allomuricauda algicola]